MIDLPVADRVRVLTRNEGWFGCAPAEFRDAVLARCEWRTLAAGETVYRVIDEDGALYGIAEGSLEIHGRFGPGDNPLLHVAHEGFWFGVGPLLIGGPRRATVVARRESLLARAPERRLRELLAARPEWWRVLGAAAQEYGDIAMGICADVLIPDSRRRCASTLLRITGLRPPRRARPERADAPVTQHELATRVNLSRTTLSQVLRAFEREGSIELGYRALRVLDEARLAAVAAGQAHRAHAARTNGLLRVPVRHEGVRNSHPRGDLRVVEPDGDPVDMKTR